MVVENRPGAGTIIGTQAASRAAPDGNTLLFNTANLVISPHLQKVNYDPLTGFESICLLAKSPQLIVVNGASPYRTFADLMNAARAKTGDVTLAGGGTAVTRITFEMLKRAANVDITFVPYPGTPPVISALLGEHVASAFSEYPAAVEQVKAGKLRALAVLSRTRIESLPDVPTVAELGYTDYQFEFWYGQFAPAKTPKETVSQLAGWFTAALEVPDIRSRSQEAARLTESVPSLSPSQRDQDRDIDPAGPAAGFRTQGQHDRRAATGQKRRWSVLKAQETRLASEPALRI
jgi:tripartite-type tricarboxylate transporter receptor subunit TctC